MNDARPGKLEGIIKGSHRNSRNSEREHIQGVTFHAMHRDDSRESCNENCGGLRGDAAIDDSR